ncbi:MAG TPA: NAD-dependent epimerase/dehydratase family protein [Solirubrobacteraceae bacterium]|jgi:UDP-glucose 4-epimerase|nr:NAD-dependent epimerase/dehydratase family protein [Solirubrobacteraceae bacterium]
MVVVVNGAYGFIGRAVASRLEADGETVVRCGRPSEEIPSAGWSARLAGAAPDVVVHCAGPASVGASIEDPAADRAGSVDVLEAVLGEVGRLPRPPRFLLVSSAAVYGDPGVLPIAETAPPAPVSPYGRHRLLCERLLSERHRGRELPVAVARVFSAYGEGLRRQLLWDVARQALDGGVVALSGTGEETRDFLHVEDVARALATIAREAAFADERINVASGEETTVRAVAERLTAELGGARVEFDGRERSGDPRRWRADVTALRALGFGPAVPLDAGLARYARWARAEHGRR